jgi:hypothetical protein
MASAGCEPACLGTKGQHVTSKTTEVPYSDPHIFGATIQNSVARELCSLLYKAGYQVSCFHHSYCSDCSLLGCVIRQSSTRIINVSEKRDASIFRAKIRGSRARPHSITSTLKTSSFTTLVYPCNEGLLGDATHKIANSIPKYVG